MNKQSKLIILSGVTGLLGESYQKAFCELNEFKILTITKKEFMDIEAMRAWVAAIDFGAVTEILYLHCIGRFKFEDPSAPADNLNPLGIDVEVYESNADTFNRFSDLLVSCINSRLKNNELIKLKYCAFGSVSDKYQIPYWQSFTRAKNILRERMRSLVGFNGKITTTGLFINLSSVNTHNERGLRPGANREYWLDCDEIVRRTMSMVLDTKVDWAEIDIFKTNPNFNNYYQSHERILNTWRKEMVG